MLFSSGIFDVVEPNSPNQALPLRLSLSPDKARTTARLLLIIPGLGVLLVPAALAGFLLLFADPTAIAPYDGLTFSALALLPVLWFALTALACLSVLPRMRRKRLVTVTAEQVSVIETGLTGARSWRLPVGAYRGITHHVRASAGVVNHEIILVHGNPDRSVLLHTAPIVNQTSLDHFSGLLRLPVIAAREVYRVRLSSFGILGAGKAAHGEAQSTYALQGNA